MIDGKPKEFKLDAGTSPEHKAVFYAQLHHVFA